MTVEEIAAQLVAQGKRVSVAEADTCGLVGYLLSTVPGSSQFFPGGVIAYTGGLKQSILGVSDELYKTTGSVSPEMAIAMARGVRPGFCLGASDEGLSVEHVAIVLGRVRIPGLSLGRLPSVSVHAVRFTALEDSPWLELLVLGFGPGFCLVTSDEGLTIEHV